MNKVTIETKKNIGHNFIPEKFLPQGKDEYYLRNQQTKYPENHWRHLESAEIHILTNNGNYTNNWDNILVTDQFDPMQIRNNEFYGLVRIGHVRDVALEHHDTRVPVGITNSRIVSCDIGNDVAIHNVLYLTHYIIGDNCILFNISEMHTTSHAKWGNGVLKEGEIEEVRVWMHPMNEAGGRRVLPFDGMNTTDAYLWCKYRGDTPLQERLLEITKNSIDLRRGYYSTVGNNTVIKNSQIVKDVKIGENCYIKGANKLKNLTINSSEEETTQIGEGVELVNGIIGYGCNVFYGCKAVLFVLGNNSSLKYGARLINSILGDNSTISCCEVLNNLIFPSHEQHHNNSFLIASVVMGQSNMAAGATIGSNHNSRANDNEMEAGRGFWPGLCTSLKQSCKFASFILLAKSDYQYEMNIPLPFSLVSNNLSKDQLEIIPAYWWRYNMYALARNNWKYEVRDTRKTKRQHIEYDSLAPDSIEDIKQARKLLEIFTAKAALRRDEKNISTITINELQNLGHSLLNEAEKELNNLEVFGEGMEKSNRKIIIKKPYQSYHAYGDMLFYYAVKTLRIYLKDHPEQGFETMSSALQDKGATEWVNMGGQLIPKRDVNELRKDIAEQKLKNWTDIHNRYDELWDKYDLEKQRHAFSTLCFLFETDKLTIENWNKALDKSILIQQYIETEVFKSRQKDYDCSFRKITFENEEEMNATLGTIEDNSFIKLVKEETAIFIADIEELKKKG